MTSKPGYTAVSISHESKKDLDALQVALSNTLGKRLTYSQTVTAARNFIREHGVDLPNMT
jgi:hypothetical protein